jgi:ankyrin repeat protein
LLLQPKDGELVAALRARDVARVEIVLRSGASPDERVDDWAVTPLMLAAELNYPEIVQVLLDAGANLEAKDRVNATALMYAAAAQGQVNFFL